MAMLAIKNRNRNEVCPSWANPCTRNNQGKKHQQKLPKPKQQEKKEWQKKTEKNIQELWEKFKRCKICVIAIRKREESKRNI